MRRRFARLARAAALAALAFAASAPPASAQDAATESAEAAPRRSATTGRIGPRVVERSRVERLQLQREAPPGFASWLQELRPLERRRVERHLSFLPPLQRERWFRQWSHLSLRERRELAASLSPLEARRRRELPPRLRTPEIRERLAAMSPDERRAFVERVREWREMPPVERDALRLRLERFGALGAADQEKLVNERFARRTPEERARILAELRASSQQLRDVRAAGEPSPPEERAPDPSRAP